MLYTLYKYYLSTQVGIYIYIHIFKQMWVCVRVYICMSLCILAIALKNKYLNITPRKRVWNPCEQNYKILMKKIKEDINKKDTQYTWIEAEGIVLPNYKPYYNNIT